MNFWKMNGAGNDFVILNNLEEQLPQEAFPGIARTLCERHLSIGADGLMAVDRPSEGSGADVRMLFFNSDGSLGEMCGNGARCICRYVCENGLSKDPARPVIETTAGIVSGERIDRRLYRVRLNDPSVVETEKQLVLADGSVISCAYVELGCPGLPHLVVEYKGAVAQLCNSGHLADADEHRLRELGRALRWHKDLPKGANVNFIEITGPDEVYERTFERGVEDFTYACGTGTGSSALILTRQQKASGRNICFNMTGGRLFMDIEENGIFLTGPTNIVAKGVVTDEELAL